MLYQSFGLIVTQNPKELELNLIHFKLQLLILIINQSKTLLPPRQGFKYLYLPTCEQVCLILASH